MSNCNRVGCEKPGRWRPVLLLRANLKHRPAAGALKGILVCDDCKPLMKPTDLIIDKAWDQIVDSFKGMGRAIPVRVLTQLGWERVG